MCPFLEIHSVFWIINFAWQKRLEYGTFQRERKQEQPLENVRNLRFDMTALTKSKFAVKLRPMTPVRSGSSSGTPTLNVK